MKYEGLAVNPKRLEYLFEPPENCEELGHVWLFMGRAEDGTLFYRCRRCGIWLDD